MGTAKTYKLLGADGQIYLSSKPGTLGGHRRGKRYGRLDCPAALRAIAKGGYLTERVFFADEANAIAARFRPCNTCMRERYVQWRRGGVLGTAKYPWHIKPMD
jgi:hypothetical protein